MPFQVAKDTINGVDVPKMHDFVTGLPTLRQGLENVIMVDSESVEERYFEIHF